MMRHPGASAMLAKSPKPRRDNQACQATVELDQPDPCARPRDRRKRRVRRGAGDLALEPESARVRAAGIRDRRVRDALRRSEAARLELAPDAGASAPGDVDLGRDVRSEGTRA